MSSKKVTANLTGKKAAGGKGNLTGKKAAGVRSKVKGIRDPFASREVDLETVREVADLVIALHWDALKELEHR